MKASALITILALTAFSSCQKNNASSTATELSEAEFQSFISQPGTLNIVDFHADWCGQCKYLSPILADAVETNSDIARIGKIDVDDARQLATRLGVGELPDVRFYIDGKMVQKFTGVYPQEQIERMIEVHKQSVTPAGHATLLEEAGGIQDEPPLKENPPPPGLSVE
jgi:thioredoxin 1